VVFPSYLDRPQIVTRKGTNELHVAELDRWAEPLKENFSRVLVENLSALLQTEHMLLFPWKGSAPPVYSVAVDVTRFEREPGGSVVFRARWTLTREKERKVLARKTSTFTKPVGKDGSYGELVAAKSEALADLSAEIASAIRAAPREAAEE
jgi:uncharacterized lipoprotein YmbA